MTEKGDKVSGTYERTFVVAVPVARAWQAFTDPQEREAWAGSRDRMEDPAFAPMAVDRLAAAPYSTAACGYAWLAINMPDIKKVANEAQRLPRSICRSMVPSKV